MNHFFKVNLTSISFIFVPILFLWHPSWLGIFRIQPYWPLFWLLPWSMIYGSTNGFIVGLFFGLILDAISLGNSFTQIPGLILCGIWFGRFKVCPNFWVGHFRYGLICAFGTFFCGSINFLQILIKDLSEYNFFSFLPSIKIILTQVFLTGLFGPLFCSQLFILLKRSQDKKNNLSLSNK